MLAQARRFRWLWRHLGPGWIVHRLAYAWRRRMGCLRRSTPAKGWAGLPLADSLRDANLAEPEAYKAYRLSEAPRFFFAARDRQSYRAILQSWDGDGTSPVALADELGRGIFRFFGNQTAQLGFPPDWHANPFSGDRAPAHRHWSQIDDFGSGDIKVIWEANRFGAAYTLVRAYWRTGDEVYPERFWNLVEDWREKNPPQLGPNWKCGQEISFRVMAWCFGLYGFLDSPASTPQRVSKLAQMMAVSGERIQANIAYALSQHNNHGISEAMGLWTIGTLFPEFRGAAAWREIGSQILEDLGRELIYEDGAFSQSSANYHRLMLHDYLWCLRLGDLVGDPFSEGLRRQLERAFDFQRRIQVGDQGEVPNYGQNDGALILPLNNCHFQDFRPAIQAMSYLLTGNRYYQAGPWDEDLLWLFGPQALSAPVIAADRVDLRAEAGGCYLLSTESSHAFIRCAKFRHRPSHADMLHIDLWWLGENVAVDAGTYAYEAPIPWNNPLAGTRYHNTVTVEGFDQMDRVGRFLWLPWLTCRVQSNQTSSAGSLAYWQGEHDGYQRLKPPAYHRRGVLRMGDDSWLVLDRLHSKAARTYVAHWLFPDLAFGWDQASAHLILHLAKGDYHVYLGALGAVPTYSLLKADDRSPRGWRAPSYRSRKAALSLESEAKGSLDRPTVSFWALLGPNAFEVQTDETGIKAAAAGWIADVQLQAADSDLIVGMATMSGSQTDCLDVTS